MTMIDSKESLTSTKDWTGNYNSIFKTLGTSNHVLECRQSEDYYATDPYAIDILLNDANYKFPTNNLLEPAAGGGHLSKRLEEYGYNVTSYDIADRGYSKCAVKNFFDIKEWNGSVITNPPYKYAQKFVEHALEIIPEGQEVLMFLKLLFLESKNRKKLFAKYPLHTLYVSCSRISCAKNGDFTKYQSGALAYGWYRWVKGYKGESIIKWVN